MTSSLSSTPFPARLAINNGSIGEMPPRTRGSPGASVAIASPARRAMVAKRDQSGSSSRSQCDLLLGSFHSIAASIILQSSPLTARLRWIDGAEGCRGLGRPAHKNFLLGIGLDHKAGAAQHRGGAGTVGDPPVGVVAG